MNPARAGSRSLTCSVITFICSSSCAIDAPGRSRAIIWLNSLPRALSDICAGVNANGMSSAMSRPGSWKSGGRTPTTRCATPLTRMSRPTMPRSAA